jgi:hypothetical protein
MCDGSHWSSEPLFYTTTCLPCAVHAVNGYMAMRVKVLNHLDEVTQVIQNFED